MTDKDDVAIAIDQSLGLAMHFGNQRARRIEVGKSARFGIGRHAFGNAMRRKNDRGAVGHFVKLIDEHSPLRLQRVDHVTVMDNLVSDIDGRAMLFDRQFDDSDGAVDTGAKSARCSDKQVKGRTCHKRASTRLLARAKVASY